MKTIVYIGLFILFGTSLKAHPIKMTTGKLEIDTRTKSCILTLNLFSNDFEDALKVIYPVSKFDFEHPDEELFVIIQKYIVTNFELLIDREPVSFEVKNIDQIEENVCQVILNGNIGHLDHFEVALVKDALLFSSFSKQTNIIHLIINSNKPQILQFYKNVPVRTVNFLKQNNANPE